MTVWKQPEWCWPLRGNDGWGGSVDRERMECGRSALAADRVLDRSGALSRIASGVAGLDGILARGFPAGRTTPIGCGPDVGKTVLALDFSGVGLPALIDVFILLQIMQRDRSNIRD